MTVHKWKNRKKIRAPSFVTRIKPEAKTKIDRNCLLEKKRFIYSLFLTVPLINDGQFKEKNQRRKIIVEIVSAVLTSEKRELSRENFFDSEIRRTLQNPNRWVVNRYKLSWASSLTHCKKFCSEKFPFLKKRNFELFLQSNRIRKFLYRSSQKRNKPSEKHKTRKDELSSN